jgi:hypothetical protein
MLVFPKACPTAAIIPAIHCTPANLTRIYHSNICWRYCSSSHGQWSSHCFTETANQHTCNPKLVYKIEIGSQRIQVDPRNIHYTKRNVPPSLYKQCATPPRRGCQVSWATPRQETHLAQTHFRKTETTRNHPTKMYWLFGQKSKLSTSNKLLIYKTILKPIWNCGKQLWGTASTSNTERFQSKALRMIVGTPWYVLNTVIRRDRQIPTVKEVINGYSSQYSAPLCAHPNGLVVNLMELPDNRRLRRHLPNDLPTRFLM